MTNSPIGRHVVHLTSVHPAFDSRIFHKECISLTQAGYRVSLIAPHDKSGLVRDIWIEALPRERRRFRRMTVSVSRVYRKALALNGDIYHFHDPELIPVGLLLQWRGCKVIYDAHEDTPRSLLEVDRDYLPQGVKRPVSWMLEQLEHYAAHRYTAVIAATPTIAERFSTIQPQTVTINNFPIQREFVTPGDLKWSERLMAVAYVGGISHTRGLTQMVEAMTLIPNHLGVRLKLAGDFTPPSNRPAFMQSSGWNHVDGMGILDRQEVAHLLNSVRAGLVVLHPLPRFMVSQPIKLFEYMSAGIPVIASDFPLWREVIDGVGCGLLVDPLNSHAIAHAIEYVLTHPAEAEEMGRRGRKAVETTYNWDAEETKLIALYDNLLA